MIGDGDDNHVVITVVFVDMLWLTLSLDWIGDDFWVAKQIESHLLSQTSLLPHCYAFTILYCD